MNKSKTLVILAMLIAMIVAIPQATAFGTNVYNVSGFKLNSSDNAGIEGWTINISNGTINMQDVTDVNGSYMFSGLSNGTYTLTENPMTDWTNVSPSTIEVTVIGKDVPNQNFTNMPTVPVVLQPYVVSGFKLNSSDNTGLQGWTIRISNGTINMQDVTDVNGSYMFSSLSNGTYNITENPKPDWTNVSPSTIEVTVIGKDLPNQNFTNMPTVPVVLQPYVVSGFKLNSSDNTGLKGWTISISNGTINMQDVTDINGLYMFSGLSNGTYNITENPKPDWTNVSPSTIEVTVNGSNLPNQNFTNMLTAQPPDLEVAYIVIVPYSVSLHTGEELQFHAQAYNANDTKIDANISYVIKNNKSNVGTITESGLFSALKSGSVRITASSGDTSDTAVVTVTNIDHRHRHGNRHHNSDGWQYGIGTVS